MTDFEDLVDLADARVGGAVLAANDEFFAPKENLIKPELPIFIDGKYTDRGKWMDGWETRRRREPGCDWCIVRLGLPGVVRGLVVDTSYFKGNYPEHCSLEGASFDGYPEAARLSAESARWVELLGKSPLAGDTKNRFAVAGEHRVTHLRLNIFPDGGVARLRVYGTVTPDWDRLAMRGDIDLAAIEHGGRVIASSDMFFGSRGNLIMPGPARHMGEGWETRRRRGPGHDWAVVQLGTRGEIVRLEVDTTHFKGNAPESCSVDACLTAALVDGPVAFPSDGWRELLAWTCLQPHTRHVFDRDIRALGPVSHLRLNIFPDGGVSRFRAYGRPVTP